jgi:hypothetical protein
MADQLPDTYFVGRLGTYKYYNMDQVVAQALATFKKILHEENLRDTFYQHSILENKNGTVGRY